MENRVPGVATPNLDHNRSNGSITHLIHKLRWMGLEEEARKMEAQLVSCGMACNQTVVVTPPDTD